MVKDLLMFADIVIFLSLMVDQKVIRTENAQTNKLVLSTSILQMLNFWDMYKTLDFTILCVFILCTQPSRSVIKYWWRGKTTRPIDKPNSVQESNTNRWDPEKVELFHYLVEDKVDIIKVLENETKNTTVEQITLEFIDNIVERTGEILVRSAKDTFGEKPVHTN